MRVKELLDRIQYRLGQQKDATGWITQRPIIMTMVQDTADMLDDEFRDRLRYVPNVELKPAMKSDYDQIEALSAYHPPEDADPHWIDELSTLWSGIWHHVPKGITQSMRDNAYVANPTFSGWDVMECGLIEVWPHPTTFHKVRVSYTREPIDYSDEDQCVDMDHVLLTLLTLDTAIPFYGRPDAEQNNRHLNRHLGNVKAKQLNGLRFTKNQVGTPRPGTPDHADMIYAWPIHAK